MLHCRRSEAAPHCSIPSYPFELFESATLGANTKFFSQNQLVSKILIYVSFAVRMYEETKNIFWASDVVAALTHVERFYN